VLRRPDIIERLAALGIEPLGSSPEEFNRFFRAELEKWAIVIKTTGITSE
jgi:tripartite-type tricarboxylate transporter receptor subunit TctC